MTAGQLLDSLVQGELREARRSDAVIFLGTDKGTGTATVRFSVEPRPPIPPFSYIRLFTATPPGPVGAISPKYPMELHDLLIPHLVSKLKGSTFDVGIDKQFDQAVEKICRPLVSSQ